MPQEGVQVWEKLGWRRQLLRGVTITSQGKEEKTKRTSKSGAGDETWLTRCLREGKKAEHEERGEEACLLRNSGLVHASARESRAEAPMYSSGIPAKGSPSGRSMCPASASSSGQAEPAIVTAGWMDGWRLAVGGRG